MCISTSTSAINTTSSMNLLKIKRSKAMIAPPIVPKKNTNKAVRFNHNVYINKIPTHRNYSLEERLSVWYTKEDYHSFQNKNKNRPTAIILLKSGYRCGTQRRITIPFKIRIRTE